MLGGNPQPHPLALGAAWERFPRAPARSEPSHTNFWVLGYSFCSPSSWWSFTTSPFSQSCSLPQHPVTASQCLGDEKKLPNLMEEPIVWHGRRLDEISDTFHSPRVLQAPSKAGQEHFQGGGCHSFSGKSVPLPLVCIFRLAKQLTYFCIPLPRAQERPLSLLFP